MTQHFAPERKIITQNIRTPGLEKMHRAFYIRLLVVERIRCFMDQVTFSDNPMAIITRQIQPPSSYKDKSPMEKDAYVKHAAEAVLKDFHKLEESSAYQEDFKALLPYKGHVWHLASSSEQGVLISIEV